MDVIFEPQKGNAFAIEVGFFDTVLEIKEKIEKYHSIPIPKQTLIFNGRTLEDECDVESCEILQDSHIQLLVSSSELDQQQQQQQHNNSNNFNKFENNNNIINNNNQSSPAPATTANSNKIHLNININIPSNQSQFPIEIDPNDSIRRLKERIHEIDAVGPINRIILQSNGSRAELHDQRSLRDCDLSDNSEIEVCLRPSPAASGTTTTTTTTTTAVVVASKNKLKVMVKPKCGSSKIPMEVNATDNVGELKKELQKLQQRLHFHLPPEGFFFIYDRDVMDEDRSFRWHGVAHGDTIEIFNGSVTGGS